MNELNGDAEPQNVQSKSRHAFVFSRSKEGHFTFYTINKIASLRGAFLKVFIFYSITSSKMNA